MQHFSDIKGYDGLGNTGFKILGSNIAGIPTGVYIFAVLAIISVIILKKLPFGWYVLAVGGNEKLPVFLVSKQTRSKLSFT